MSPTISGTDAALLVAGYACVTPLVATCEQHRLDITGLADTAPAEIRETLLSAPGE